VDQSGTYVGGKGIKPSIGDVVMVPGDMRGIVIAVKGTGTFVTVLGIGTSKETGDTFVLRHVHDYAVSRCHYMEKQTLNLG
jgi:hypothetical protein